MAETIEALAEEKAKGPAFGKAGTARPAETGPLPRRISPLDRATPGTTRFKLWVRGEARNYAEHALQYVLVKAGKDAEKDARDYFAKDVNMPAIAKRLSLEVTGIEVYCFPLAD